MVIVADRDGEAALLRELAGHGTRLQFAAFDNDTSWRLGVLMLESARRRGLALAVDIRRHGQVLFHAATAGTSPDNESWLERKRRVVDLCAHSSSAVGLQARHDGGSFADWWGLDPTLYAADGGAFPVLVRGTGMVGTIAVSGLSPAEDHAFVVESLQAHLTATTGSACEPGTPRPSVP